MYIALLAIVLALAFMTIFIIAQQMTTRNKQTVLKYRVAEACVCNERIEIDRIRPMQSTRLVNCLRSDHCPARVRYLQVVAADRRKPRKTPKVARTVSYIGIQLAENRKGSIRLRNNRRVVDVIHYLVGNLIQLINEKGDTYNDNKRR
jgi:hypothetical protein